MHCANPSGALRSLYEGDIVNQVGYKDVWRTCISKLDKGVPRRGTWWPNGMIM